MLKNAALAVFAAFILLLVPAAHAQWVVHARTGTLKSINTNAKMIYLNADDGTTTKFTTAQTGDTKVEFDPKLRAETTPADSYSSVGAHVVVFYYGWGDTLTAVSVEPLASGSYTMATGKVEKFDKHSHMLTITNDKGATVTYHVPDSAVIDTGNGVKEGAKFDPRKNDPVRIMVASSAQGEPDAVFIQRNDISAT